MSVTRLQGLKRSLDEAQVSVSKESKVEGRDILSLPSEILQCIFRKLSLEAQGDVARVCRSFAIMVPFSKLDRLSDDYDRVMKSLKPLIDLLSQKEQEEAFKEFKTPFLEVSEFDSWLFKLKNVPACVEEEQKRKELELACSRSKGVKELYDVHLCSKIAIILHSSLKLPIEDMNAMAKKIFYCKSSDEIYKYLCDQILLKVLGLNSLDVYRTQVCVEALQLVTHAIKDIVIKSRALADVCYTCLVINDLVSALLFAREIPDMDIKSKKLADISDVYIDDDDLVHAVMVAREIPGDKDRAERLARASDAYQTRGDLVNSLVVAREIPLYSVRFGSLNLIRETYQKQSNFEAALAIEKEIREIKKSL